jgi:sugar lactone lactonase YvrE
MRSLSALLLVACEATDPTTPTTQAADPALEVIAAFDPAAWELPEGLAVHAGEAYVSFAGLGQVHRVPLDGSASALYASVPALTPDTSFVTGISFDEAGRLNIAQPSFTADPVAGVYRAPEGGGTATLFAAHPQLVFPSDAEADEDGALYVTDSATGVVLRAEPDGTTDVWATDPLLFGDRTACGNDAAAFDVGGNGLVWTDDAVYVANTDHGAILRIPIAADGTAGAVEVFAGPDCDALGGIDGLAFDGEVFYAALNRQDRVVRIDADGSVTPVFDDPVLDFPSAVRAVDLDGRAALLVTSFAYDTALAGGDARPALLRAWLE